MWCGGWGRGVLMPAPPPQNAGDQSRKNEKRCGHRVQQPSAALAAASTAHGLFHPPPENDTPSLPHHPYSRAGGSGRCSDIFFLSSLMPTTKKSSLKNKSITDLSHPPAPNLAVSTCPEGNDKASVVVPPSSKRQSLIPC